MQTKLLEEIHQVLSDFPHYWDEDTLLKNKVIEDLRNYEPILIDKLLATPLIKDSYSLTLSSGIVFKIEDFISMLRFKTYWDNSYTKFSNEIGLTSDNKYLKYNSDVVLDFPHKDCVLEASMTKEDIGKKEIYYHSVLAKEEIDTLLSPKVFKNAIKYDSAGEKPATTYNDRENLLIKGNNLIALHSLKKRFSGKIKLIYIDPPYNTGNDSFKYNDRFNHATWLTFMRNRLEIAKELLAEDGSIFVQIDDSEDSYLKVLMDEIFGRNNFRNKITWKRRGGSANPSNRLNNVVEYILWYSKNENVFQYTPVFTLDDENTQKYIEERFNNIDSNGRRFMKSPLQSPNYRANLIYDYKGYKTPPKGYSIKREVMEQWDKEGKLHFPEKKSQNINRKIYLDEYKGQPISSLWSDIFVINPMSKERVEFTSGQKPEALLKRIMDMVTKENDIVLDFFVGSGTTAAVALKTNRQFIGIEQMNYINTTTVDRLKDVIDGEQGGISKEVSWKGGGEFTYIELFELNSNYVSQIHSANSIPELMEILSEMKEQAFFDFKITIDRLTNANQTFKSLSLSEMKEILIEVLDANQMYLSFSEIDDYQYAVADSLKEFNNSFYKTALIGDKL